MDAMQRPQAGPAERRRIGVPSVLVLLVGAATTVLLFLLALASVHDSEHSLVREHTAQTFGVIQTVAQQVEAIVSAGTAAARYTNGDPLAFKRATALRVESSLFSDLSLVRLGPGGPILLASVGRSPPLLLGHLSPAARARLARVARSGLDITYVASGPYRPGGRVVGFAATSQPRSTLVV